MCVCVLTEQYNDTDEYGDDGSSAQSGHIHSSQCGAVSVAVTGTHLHLYDRPVGEGGVPRVRHDHRDLLHPRLQVHLIAQTQTTIVPYEREREGERKREGGRERRPCQ